MEENVELQKDNLSEGELINLKNIFGESESIKFEKKDGKISVSTELADGIAEGGQKINFTLSEMKLIEKSRKHEWINAFEVEKFSINDVDVTSDFSRVFFEVRKEKGSTVSGTLSKAALEQKLERKKTERREKGEKEENAVEDHIVEVWGTSVAPDEKGWRIFLTTLKNADDLVSIFHEQGHIEDPDYYSHKFLKARSDYWLNNINPSAVNSKTSEEKTEMVNTWKTVIAQEVSAHKNALNLIVKLSDKVSMFKSDSKNGLMRVRKSLEYAMLGYVNQMNGWYKQQLNSRELSELTNISS